MESNYNFGIVTQKKVLFQNGDLKYICKKIPSEFEIVGKRFSIKSLRFYINNKIERLKSQLNKNQIILKPFKSESEKKVIDLIKDFLNILEL
jgi:hypothetical protein